MPTNHQLSMESTHHIYVHVCTAFIHKWQARVEFLRGYNLIKIDVMTCNLSSAFRASHMAILMHMYLLYLPMGTPWCCWEGSVPGGLTISLKEKLSTQRVRFDLGDWRQWVSLTLHVSHMTRFWRIIWVAVKQSVLDMIYAWRQELEPFSQWNNFLLPSILVAFTTIIHFMFINKSWLTYFCILASINYKKYQIGKTHY